MSMSFGKLCVSQTNALIFPHDLFGSTLNPTMNLHSYALLLVLATICQSTAVKEF